LTTFVFWALVIWAIVALVSWARDSRPPGPAGPERGDAPAPGEDAEQILARRFAAGEIDAAEYHRRLDVLRGRQTGGK
jgi:putative membrane protein